MRNLLAVGVLFVVGCGSSAEKKAAPILPPPLIVVDVPQLAGKTQPEIEKILGAPGKCETETISKVGSVPACEYQSGKIEVVFINGVADWIDINNVNLPWTPQSLASFGFKDIPPPGPTPMPEQVMYWTDQMGFHGINYGPGAAGLISFIHFKWKTD